MLHKVLACMGKTRVAWAASEGGPKGAGNMETERVSTTRHGVIPTNTNEFTGVCACAVSLDPLPSRPDLAVSSASARLGCQYSGAGQFFSGAASGSPWALAIVADTMATQMPHVSFIQILLLF